MELARVGQRMGPDIIILLHKSVREVFPKYLAKCDNTIFINWLVAFVVGPNFFGA